MAKKSKDNQSITFYPSFRALAAAAKADSDANIKDDNTKDPDTGDADTSGVELRSALDYPAEPVEWLWPEKIALGKVTLLIGDPGLGKSLIAIDAASRVSTGSAWPAEAGSVEQGARSATAPDSLPGHPQSGSAPGSVLILSAEDQIADTIRPRLDAHGADPARVFFASQITDLRRDLNRLVATLDKLPDCRLIVVDPVNAYVGPSDSHFHTIVRKVLAPLAELAAKRRIAILAVTHLRKNSGAAITRAAGSMGFVAASRSVWTVCRDNTSCRDQTNPGRNLLLPVKNNLGPLGTGLAYSIGPHSENGAAIIHWHADPVTVSAEDALTPPHKPRGPEAEERRHAGEWLLRALADGPREAHLVLREGKQNGFGGRTLQRALHMIGGQTQKQSYDNGWFWSLPPTDPDASPPASHSGNVEAAPEKPVTVEKAAVGKPVAFDETCRLREKHDEYEKLDPVSAPSPPPPGPAASIAFLHQLDAERTPPDGDSDAEKDSPTGQPHLDQILADFRKSPTTNDQRLSSARKKSARSHSRFLREPTPGTSLAQRTTHDPERCIAATFPPM